MAEPPRKSICKNRKARFQYSIEETIEAGLVLTGSEVKSLRAGGANLVDSYAQVHGSEVFLHKAHIAPYVYAGRENHLPERVRKLLMHRREIHRLGGRLREKGLTLVPLELYFKNGRAKVELGLARGKKLHDKRQAIADRESDRRLRQVTRRHAKRGGG
ncbi:MAG TPA: SsrA-binding protein SmpB [Myxococcota bacterium]|nr:SsrA-binding protein SmpB [Myxococcota bacterium]